MQKSFNKSIRQLSCLDFDKDRILQFYVMASFPDNHTRLKNKPHEFETHKL